MTIWAPNLEGHGGPKSVAIADGIAQAIADGTLERGTKLPPQRELAGALGISLSTVTRAYAEARRRGLVVGEVGRGTFVRAPERGDEEVPRWFPAARDAAIDFSMNLPMGGPPPQLAETLARISGDDALPELLDQNSIDGLEAHAEAGAAWITKLGMQVSSDEIVLSVGAQHGVLVSLMATTRPGDVLLTEELTYPPLVQIAQHLDLTLHPIEMDERGLRPEAVDEACRKTTGRVLYCMPTLHSPTAATMPETRRREVARIAARHDLTIIEDDAFGFYPANRPPPVASYAPEHTLLVTSVSKSVAPWLRIGYVRSPERYHGRVRTAVHMSCWMPSPLMAEVARRWITDGTADQLASMHRDEARTRQQIAGQLLDRFPYQADPSGLHIWLPLPKPWRPDMFRIEAERLGVKVLTGDLFAVGSRAPTRAIRLCLGRERHRHRVRAGLETIARLLDGTEGSGLAAV